MSITDELREWLNEYGCEYGSEKFIAGLFGSIGQDRLLAIADRIDAEHESKVSYWQGASYKDGYDEGFASADDWLAQHEDAMAEHGWVRLPLDADGVPIRVGDEMCQIRRDGTLADPFEVAGFELVAGELWPVEKSVGYKNNVNPRYLRHYHEPTVEDVLYELTNRLFDDDESSTDKELIAEYAAKLRLAGEDE